MYKFVHNVFWGSLFITHVYKKSTKALGSLDCCVKRFNCSSVVAITQPLPFISYLLSRLYSWCNQTLVCVFSDRRFTATWLHLCTLGSFLCSRKMVVHLKMYTQRPCLLPVSFMLSCFNTLCHFTPLFNLCCLIFGLAPFDWLHSITLISFLIMPTFSGIYQGCKIRGWVCTHISSLSRKLYKLILLQWGTCNRFE